MNTHSLTSHDLHRLGLNGWTAGLAEPVGIGADSLVQLGFTQSPSPELRRVIELDLAFESFDLKDALNAGIHLNVLAIDPKVIRFDCEDHLLVMPCPDLVGVDATDPTAVLVDTRALTEPIAVLHGPHRGVYVLPGGRVGRLHREAVHVHSDLLTWYADDHDTWLRDQLAPRVTCGDPWQHAVAIGLAARLRQRTPDDARATLNALLAGLPVANLHRERRWATQQPREVLDALDNWAVVAAETLTATLEDLFEASDPDDEAWQDAMMDTLHHRDDLEGVRLLLREASAGHALEVTLDDLDPICRNLIDAVTTWAVPFDERLGRASTASPDAWWTAPIAWTAPYTPNPNDP